VNDTFLTIGYGIKCNIIGNILEEHIGNMVETKKIGLILPFH
jgi:hypothetical protein